MEEEIEIESQYGGGDRDRVSMEEIESQYGGRDRVSMEEEIEIESVWRKR